MAQDPQTMVLAEIHKQLCMIAGSLEILARVAQAEHPEIFKNRPAGSPIPGIPNRS
jgi:hypothetical protein